MSKKEDEKRLKKLADLDEKIRNLVKEYNLLAKTEDHGARLAILTASAEIDDDGEEEFKGTLEEYVSNRDYPPYCSVDAPEADVWFPSSICSGF